MSSETIHLHAKIGRSALLGTVSWQTQPAFLAEKSPLADLKARRAVLKVVQHIKTLCFVTFDISYSVTEADEY